MSYRRDSLAVRLMEHIMRSGMCYKSDLYMLGRRDVSAVRMSQVMSELTSSGHVLVSSLKMDDHRDEQYCVLTKKGRVALLDVLDDPYWYEHSQDAEKDSRTTNKERLVRRLDASRVQTAMTLSNVPCHKKDKPQLFELYRTLSAIPIEDEIIETDKSAYASLPPADMARLLRDGIYYTMEEVREFFDQTEEGSADLVYGSKARGIFISRNNMFVVYIGTHRKNKLIRIARETELRLVNLLGRLVPITDVTRNLNIENYGASVPAGTNAIWGIVISDGNSMVYSMATGNPKGKIKGTDKMEVDQQRREYLETNGMSMSMSWLKGNGDIFPRLFVTPFTANGIGSLQYILSTSAEEWRDGSLEILNRLEGIKATRDFVYPATINGIPAIYMPAYEVNELYRMSQTEYGYAILSYPDMYETIAHSIRKDCQYINADELVLETNEVGRYGRSGELRGKEKLEHEIMSRSLTLSGITFQKIPKLFGKSQKNFYKEIETGELSTNDVIDKLKDYLVDYEPEKKRIKRKSITLTMGEKFTNDIYRAAKHNGMSASAYVKGLIHDKVLEDAAAYAENIRTNKNEWKNNR